MGRDGGAGIAVTPPPPLLREANYGLAHLRPSDPPVTPSHSVILVVHTLCIKLWTRRG